MLNGNYDSKSANCTIELGCSTVYSSVIPAKAGFHTLYSEQDNCQEKDNSDNYSDGKHLDNKDDRLATIGVGENEMGRGGLEPPTQGFSVPCSTN